MARQWLIVCAAILLAAPGPQRDARVVLAELFTGSECGPCAAADGGFDKILNELREYEDEILYPLATRQVEIDLDDGVKVNYGKFGDLLAEVHVDGGDVEPVASPPFFCSRSTGDRNWPRRRSSGPAARRRCPG